MTVYKILYTKNGEHGRLPDAGITNIGGTSSTTFFVDGRPLLFADGTATDGSGGMPSSNLQSIYNNSSPATINLTSGKPFTLQALNSKVFSIDPATGKVTITGDLEVLGASSIIEGVLANVDQVSINPPNGSTSAFLIEPMVGVVMGTDLVRIRAQNAGLPVFSINSTGGTYIQSLTVGAVPFAQFYADFQAHIAPGGTKHAASQISVTPLSNLPGDDVQEVLEAINAVVLGSGTGTVTSVTVTSADMTVTGSPITSAGTIDLALNTIPIAKGGTGEVTAAAAINALVPPQAGNSGKVLSTNGTTVEWVTGGTGSGSSSAGLFFTDAAPSGAGIVGAKLYVPGTVPVNKVVYDATTDTNNVLVSLFAEGDASFYSPTITITTVPAQVGGPIVATLVEDANDKRAYLATAVLSVPVTTAVTAVSSTGATATMSIQRAAAGPAFSSLFITTLPGVQTEVKAGDIVGVTGKVENSATYAEIIVGGAAGALSVLTVGAPDSFGVGFRTVTGTFVVGNGTGPQTVQARGRSALGTYGAPYTSSNNVTLDQTAPVIGARTITYPVGQLGIKTGESATVNSTITNFTTVSYTATGMTVDTPTTYNSAKTVTHTSGTYQVGVQNYTITANKATNNSTTVATTAVSIVTVPPTAAITIVGNPARLFSSPTGTDYVVTITANQLLSAAPSLVASAGTWLGAGWAGSGTTYTRTLRIVDADPKGSQLFSSLQVTGLTNLVGSTITSGSAYVIGGFAARTITFPAFARWHAIGTNVTDFSKVTASYTGSSVLTRRSDTNDVFQSFTIVDVSGVFNATGGYLFISDLAFSGSNTSGTLQLTIAEAA